MVLEIMPVPTDMKEEVADTVTTNDKPLKSILKNTQTSSPVYRSPVISRAATRTRASFRLTSSNESADGPRRVYRRGSKFVRRESLALLLEKRERIARLNSSLAGDSDDDTITSDEDVPFQRKFRGSLSQTYSPLTQKVLRAATENKNRGSFSSPSDSPDLRHSLINKADKGKQPKTFRFSEKVSQLESDEDLSPDDLKENDESQEPDSPTTLTFENLKPNTEQDEVSLSDDIMADDEDDQMFQMYTGRYRGRDPEPPSGGKRVSFSTASPPVKPSWEPELEDTLSEDSQSLTEEYEDPKTGEKKVARRISNEELSEDDISLAVQYIKDAMQTRSLFFREDKVRLYQLFHKRIFVIILYICVVGDLALVLFEKPAVKGLQLPYWVTMLMEFVFLLYFLGRFLHNYSFDRRKEFWKEIKNVFLVIGLSLTVLDMIIYVALVELSPPWVACYAVRFSRPLRPIFLVAFPSGERLRLALINVVKSLPEIFAVIVLLICSIAIFALIWFQLLRDKGLVYSSGAPYFVDYFDSFWDLYVLVTTANNPDVMLPAYDYNNAFAILWFVYVSLNLYIFMNIVLAVVYNGYKTRLKQNVRDSVLRRRKILEKTFDLLKVRHDGTYAVRSDRWHRVMSQVDKNLSDTKIDLMLYVLDDNGNGAIERKEFLMLSELIGLDFAEVLERKSWLAQNCKSYDSTVSVFIRKVISHRYFEYVIDSLIVVNAGCIAANIKLAEYIFLPLFTVEILLRIYTVSPAKYFLQVGNIFDSSLIFIPWILFFIPSNIISAGLKREAMDFFLVLRIFRVVRSADSIEQFKMIFSTLAKIAPFIFTYGGVVFIFYYSYAIVGMELFHGLIKFYGYVNLNDTEMFCGNPKLNGSEFWIKRYCECNFNDFYHSVVVLFTMMVVNQWHEITNGFVLVTNKAARLYFFAFHMSCVIILLNIFSALVIEAFFIAYQVERSDMETYLQKKIRALGLASGDETEGDTEEGFMFADELMSRTGFLPGRRKSVCDSLPNDLMLIQRRLYRDSRVSNMKFQIQDKSHMRVETLLQRLFADELDMMEEEDEEALEDRWTTLDSVMDTYADMAQYTTSQ